MRGKKPSERQKDQVRGKKNEVSYRSVREALLTLKNFKWSNFLSLNVNVNSVVRSHRDGQISPFITQGTLYFPHSWLSSHGKNKFPHSLLRSSWGNLLSPFLLSHSWGKYDVPFVIHGKISFSPFVASPLKGKNPIPIPPNYGIKPFPPGLFRLIVPKISLTIWYNKFFLNKVASCYFLQF